MYRWYHPEGESDIQSAWRAFQGIMFFAYGQEEETAEHFLQEAFTSARRIKLLNPKANITLVTNPGLNLDIGGAFDLVRRGSGTYIHVETQPYHRFGSPPDTSVYVWGRRVLVAQAAV